MNFELILRYFPDLSPAQQGRFKQLGELYPEWNFKINVISRKDIDNLYERHILHSLAIAKVIRFSSGTKILDAGTGGGFPGVPLAILFPEVHFHLIDSTSKKLSVVEAIAMETGLKNISTEHGRFETHTGKYDFVVSRAVTSLDTMAAQLWKNIHPGGTHDLPNGILYLKGGDLSEELGRISILKRGGKKIRYNVFPLSAYFSEEFYQTKSLVHLF